MLAQKFSSEGILPSVVPWQGASITGVMYWERCLAHLVVISFALLFLSLPAF